MCMIRYVYKYVYVYVYILYVCKYVDICIYIDEDKSWRCGVSGIFLYYRWENKFVKLFLKNGLNLFVRNEYV